MVRPALASQMLKFNTVEPPWVAVDGTLGEEGRDDEANFD